MRVRPVGRGGDGGDRLIAVGSPSTRRDRIGRSGYLAGTSLIDVPLPQDQRQRVVHEPVAQQIGVERVAGKRHAAHATRPDRLRAAPERALRLADEAPHRPTAEHELVDAVRARAVRRRVHHVEPAAEVVARAEGSARSSHDDHLHPL